MTQLMVLPRAPSDHRCFEHEGHLWSARVHCHFITSFKRPQCEGINTLYYMCNYWLREDG